MPNLTESSTFHSGIYRIETTDPVLGGTPAFDGSGNATTGHNNAGIKQLADRTRWLKDQVDGLGLVNGTKFSQGILPTHERNCVLSGPVNTTTGGLDYIKKQTNTSWRVGGGASAPMIMSFTGGYDSITGRAVDYVMRVTSTTDINSTAGLLNVITYAVATLDTGTGALTYSETQLAPVYGFVQPTGASGQYWYDLSVNRMKLWNGTSFADVAAIILGEIQYSATVAGQIDNVRPYPLSVQNGMQIGVPVGTVVPLAFNPLLLPNTVPAGWLLCNGAAVSRITYRNLFEVVSILYGSGNGGTTFNLPDLRGEFIRGWDNGRGVDTGRTVGSFQADEFKAHDHSLVGQLQAFTPATGSGKFTLHSGVGSGFNSNYIENAGGAETRPRNIAMAYIIKF